MMVVSFFTVPLVVALPIPGIRTIVVAPFYGLPLAFISPVILMFCVASGSL
jgi:hypothetical protein